MTDQPKELPVDEVKATVVSAFADPRPLVVTAPTGSGKSTRLPLWMAAHLDGPVLVVEPRRVACRSLAGWLSDQRGEAVGGSIGYTVRFDDSTSAQTQVVFATTGVVLRMLGEREFRFAGVLVDEFHERSWQVDLIVAILRARAVAGDAIPYVITSATLQAGALAERLGAQLIEASGRTYPVDIEYAGEATTPTRRDLDTRVRQAVEAALEADPDGDILVFLPGKGEIFDCKSALSAVSDDGGADVVAVHGSLPSGQMTRALAGGEHRRRVYLATNVAETSVTLPGVTTVIDSGLARMKIHRGGRSALALAPIAQDSMEQRAGRAGRVRPGRCVRLWSQRFRPRAQTSPEVERIELDDMLLHAGVCGLDGDQFDEAQWVTRPPEFALEQAADRLMEVGALDEDRRITDKGRTLAELPVDGHDARMLIGATDAMAAMACDVVALLQLNGPLILSTGRRDTHRARAELCGGLDNQLYVEIAMLRRGDARRHKLHGAALGEARKVAASLRGWVDAPVGRPTDDGLDFPPSESFADYLLERIPEAAYVLRERALRHRGGQPPRPGRSEPWANGTVELRVWPYQPPRREGDDGPDAPRAGLVLDTFWIGDRGTGVRGHGRMLLPCTYDQLADAGLGEETLGQVELCGGGAAPRIVARVRRELAGVTLSSRREPLYGRELCEHAAQMTLDNRLFKGAGAAVRDDLHLWGVLGEWPEAQRQWQKQRPPTPVEYLADRLEQLGLNQSEELALLEGEDLRPDLVDELGVPAFEVDRFSADFPRCWEHMGRKYHCRVQPKASKVILEPANKKARRGGDPDPGHLPRFRGFSVYFRNASRVAPIRR